MDISLWGAEGALPTALFSTFVRRFTAIAMFAWQARDDKDVTPVTTGRMFVTILRRM